jgi:hypothetical protein
VFNPATEKPNISFYLSTEFVAQARQHPTRIILSNFSVANWDRQNISAKRTVELMHGFQIVHPAVG